MVAALLSLCGSLLMINIVQSKPGRTEICPAVEDSIRETEKCFTIAERYPCLLRPKEEIPQYAYFKEMTNAHVVDQIEFQVEIPGVTYPIEEQNYNARDQLTQCVSGSCDPCCKTNMYFATYHTVKSIYTGKLHEVKHFNTSYQLLHVGACERLNAACYNQRGVCRVMYRVQWILVEKDNDNDIFVPVSVPSHCYCQYQ